MTTVRSELTREDIEKMTVHEKLLHLRLEFAASGVKKTGINMNSAVPFDWYQLEDIMPTFQRLCDKYRLIAYSSITREGAYAMIVDLDNTEGEVRFAIPYADNTIIETKDGRAVTTPMQALGGGITFLRRYLYYLILDLTQSDEVNQNIGLEDKSATVQRKATRKAPPTPEKREEIKEQVAAPNGQANKMQIASLKKKLGELGKEDPSQLDYIKGIVTGTENFTKMTKQEGEDYILEVNAKLNEAKKE